jgi:hypothetical protein
MTNYDMHHVAEPISPARRHGGLRRSLISWATGLLAAVALATVPMAQPAEAAGPYVYSNSTSSVNLRNCAYPTTRGCGVMGTLPNGTSVTMLCWWNGDWAYGNYSTNRWFKIRYNGGNALIHASLVYNQVGVPLCNSGYANDGT